MVDEQRRADEPPLLDTAEYERWLRTSRRNLGLADVALQAGYHEGAVLHAEQAAQCALKGLLHGVGQQAKARGHGLVQLAAACSDLVGLDVDQELVSGLRDLATTYLSSRYPDALPEGTPEDHFDETRAHGALAVARRALSVVEEHWRLLEAAQDDDDPGVDR